MDNDLWELYKNGYYTVGYADDIAILSMESSFRTALYTVQQWYSRTNLSTQINQ
jgi:hypothetical protein